MKSAKAKRRKAVAGSVVSGPMSSASIDRNTSAVDLLGVSEEELMAAGRIQRRAEIGSRLTQPRVLRAGPCPLIRGASPAPVPRSALLAGRIHFASNVRSRPESTPNIENEAVTSGQMCTRWDVSGKRLVSCTGPSAETLDAPGFRTPAIDERRATEPDSNGELPWPLSA